MELNAGISAVVTGGTSGLGAAVVQRLTARGVKVALFGRNQAAGERLALATGGLFCPVDIVSEASIRAGFEKARARHGQERILVNCAGMAIVRRVVARNKSTGQTDRFPAEEFDRMLQVNLVGTFRCITWSVAGMVGLEALDHGERGVILNTASIAAQDGQTGQAGYAASKAGIVGMTLPLARDLMGEGIRINTIMPGIFDTPMLVDEPKGLKAMLAATIPFPKRLGDPREYADLAEALIRNAYINGESIRLDGGLRMGPR